MSWELLRRQLPKIYTPQDVELVHNAYKLSEMAHAGQKRRSGEPYMIHPEAVAGILAELRLDARTVAAALLHDVAEDTDHKIPDLAEVFGAEVASMVEGVTKLVAVSEKATYPRDIRDPKVESLRKLLLTMVNDVRVVLIKLADRLHNMRTLHYMSPDKRRRISQETLDIYAPLASALGMYRLKWELEDLSLRHIEPEAYAQVEGWLNVQRQEREAFVASVVNTLEEELARQDIRGQVSGRPKHVYSIWRKMNRKGVVFDKIYDRHGVRVIVPSEQDCYVALGIVHRLWHPIKGEFDDYIANPKSNGYQSLHTAVMVPGGQSLEIQIRTPEMDRIAEVGIAAHWRYKAGTEPDEAFETKIGRLRATIALVSQEDSQAEDFISSVKDELFSSQVYVFTPRGEAIDLPAGSTPIDFAYRIHTEVGHRCRGARVNGKLVNLNYQLQTGEQVEITTVKRGGPSRDWLNPQLGYVKTPRARTKIRQWFRQETRDESIAAGREILEKELSRLGIDTMTYQDVAGLFDMSDVDAFLAEIGHGDITTVDIAKRVLESGKVEEPPKEVTQELPTQEKPQKPAISGDGIAVQGAGNMLSYLARCCNPMPPDDILGFVTRGHGVAVHRRDCPNTSRFDPERIIQVDWGTQAPRGSRSKIRIQAYDRAGLLAEITNIFKEESINLLDASAVTARKDNLALITATIEVRDAEQLSRVLAQVQRLPNVQEVRRQKG